MLLIETIATMTEPTPIDAAAVPNDALVIYALFGCVTLLAILTATYSFRTRPKKHPLRVVRWPR